MSYIDYLNRFHLWLESHALPAPAQLMYVKLLHIFNRAGWPESVQVDNRRLMLMLDAHSENTATRARDKLVEAGFIRCEKGRKGVPNRYYLCQIPAPYTNASNSIYCGRNEGTSGGISEGTNGGHIKNKNKTKKKTSPPNPPEGHVKTYDLEELGDLLELSFPPGWYKNLSDDSA